MSWEANAVQLAGLATQTKARGLLEKTLERCSPEARAAFTDPHSARWHPGPLLAEFSEALMAVAGPATFADINYDMARQSFGPILRPMVQVALTLTGRSPGTVLARVPASATSGLRNVEATWALQDAHTGVLSFTYPGGISSNAAYAWRGVLRFISELAGAEIRETKFDYVDGRTLRFTLTW